MIGKLCYCYAIRCSIASVRGTLVTQLKALIASGVLLPIAGGATVEEYDAAIATISDGKQELRRRLDALVTHWLIASRSPDTQARQHTVETIGEELNRLIAEHPQDDVPIRTVYRYIVEEYREEVKVGEPSKTDHLVDQGPGGETPESVGETASHPAPLTPAEIQAARDWERQVQELHRSRYQLRQPQRYVPRPTREVPRERVAEPARRFVEPEEPRTPDLWLRVSVNLVGLLIVGGVILGMNYLLGNPIKQGIVWVTTHLPLVLDYLKTTVFVQ